MDFDYTTETITPDNTTILTVGGTGALELPVGNTGARPGSAVTGAIRYNTDISSYEGLISSTWTPFATGSTSITLTGDITGSGASPITTTLATVNSNIGTWASVTINAKGLATAGANLSGDATTSGSVITLATVNSSPVTASFQKITVNGKGLTTATSSVGPSDITTALGYTPVSIAGSTMNSGATITFSGGGTVTGLPTPVNSSDAAPKSYVDSLQAGLEWKDAVAAATTASLTAAYANGTAGVGATLTNSGTQVAFSVDGYSANLNDRILVKNQSTQTQDGIYTVTTVGNGSTNWVLTRATDANTSTSLNNATMFVTNGTSNGDTGWTQTTANPTIGTNNIVFVQFSGTGTYTAGTGLTLTGNAFSITAPVTPALGGTGTTSAPSAVGQLLIATSGNVYTPSTLTQGTGITIANASGSVTITNAGVTSLAGTANQITASASTGSVTLSTPSTFVAPGTIAATGAMFLSYLGSISAAGSTQGTATALTVDENVVTTTGSGQGVVLPTAASPYGRSITIFNRGANALLVYPASGAAIDGAAANAGISVPVNSILTVVSSSATQWYSTDQIPTAGTAISVTQGNGLYTIANTGVTSAVAGTGIGVSGATGAVTITNNGVTALTGTTNQVTVSGSTGSVTISTPSTFVAPGSIAATTSLSTSITSSISAAGSTQATATALTTDYNVVTSVSAGQGVALPNAASPFGRLVTVTNRGANALLVYPFNGSGASIDGAAANAGISVPVNTTATFYSSSATQWYSSEPALTAGTAISVTPGNGINTITNTGVTSAVAGTGIGVSGATGAVTITNNGVTSITGTANQITASASTGAITLSVPSTFVAPGTIAATTSLSTSITSSISAAGTTQGTATTLNTDYNVVSTVASGSGVVLPTAASPFGRAVTVVNRGANALLVYPATGAAIDGAATNAAISVPVNSEIQFVSSSATQWYTIDRVVVAGTGSSVTYGNGIVTIANTGVTSVALSDGSTTPIYTISGSPVTTTGTLTFSLSSQTANYAFLAPNGSSGQPSFRALAYADLPLKLYVENPSSPTTPTSTGSNAIAFGSGTSATAASSEAHGLQSIARVYGQIASASGDFATQGDAQHGEYNLRVITTNASPSIAYLDGSSAKLVLPNNSAFMFVADIVCRRTDATGTVGAWTITGLIFRDATASTTAISGSTSTVTIAKSNSLLAVSATADTTNGALQINVTGIASQTIRWSVHVRTQEVTN